MMISNMNQFADDSKPSSCSQSKDSVDYVQVPCDNDRMEALASTANSDEGEHTFDMIADMQAVAYNTSDDDEKPLHNRKHTMNQEESAVVMQVKMRAEQTTATKTCNPHNSSASTRDINSDEAAVVWMRNLKFRMLSDMLGEQCADDIKYESVC